MGLNSEKTIANNNLQANSMIAIGAMITIAVSAMKNVFIVWFLPLIKERLPPK